MENTDSNMKPQQTGGLKLMTVFVVVLALHVVVIGGMTTYYLLKGGSTDTDLTGDKNHKGLKANADGSLVADTSTPDATSTSATATTPAPDASTTAATPAPITPTTPDSTTASDTAPTPATTAVTTATPVTTPAAPTPVTVATVAETPSTSSQPATLATTGSALTPPADPAPAVATPDVAQTTPAPTTGTTPYVVVAHDSLAKIAHKNHLTVPALMAANNMTSDKLSIGQKLVIPGAKAPELGSAEATDPAAVATPATTTVAKAPATAKVKEAAPAMVTEKQAKAIADARLAGAKPAKGSADGHSYTIVKGDTLTKIAHKFKTTPSALMAANNITDPTKLTIGKKLTIPSRESHTATVTPSTQAQPGQMETKKSAAQLANVTQ